MLTQHINGIATSAEYADLAEIYASDPTHDAGTVVKIGGSAEIIKQKAHADPRCIWSCFPSAYLMNSEAEGLPPVALAGRCPESSW